MTLFTGAYIGSKTGVDIVAKSAVLARARMPLLNFLIKIYYYIPINDTPFELPVFGHLVQNAVEN